MRARFCPLSIKAQHLCMQLHCKWVSVDFLPLASIGLSGVSRSTGLVECPFLNDIHILRRWKMGGGGQKMHSTGFELQLDPWPLLCRSDIKTQNHLPQSARQARSAGLKYTQRAEYRAQLSAILTQNPIIWSWSHDRWTGDAHILHVSRSARPFRCNTKCLNGERGRGRGTRGWEGPQRWERREWGGSGKPESPPPPSSVFPFITMGKGEPVRRP